MFTTSVTVGLLTVGVQPSTAAVNMDVRTYGQMRSADPLPGKMDEKLKSENMQKEQFSMFMLYFESNQGR